MNLVLKLNITADDREALEELSKLSPREFMVAWTTAVKQFAQSRARERIGGDFGDDIARRSILTDTRNPDLHEVYAGGENGYIAEHIHTGGVIRPKERQYLAVPVDRSVKGMYPREYAGDLVFLRKKEDGPRGRAYLAKPMKRKIKPLWILLRQVDQRPRPWWPTDAEVTAETKRFFEENF